MKKFFFSLLVFIFLFSLEVISQNAIWEDDQLYVCVADTNAIPVIYPDSAQVIYPELKIIYEKYDLAFFELAFPSVNKITKPEKYLLDKVYWLNFKDNADSLMYELNQINQNYFYFIERVPVVYYIQGHTPDDYSLLSGQLGTDYALDKIQAQLAWGITTGNPDVIIGVADGGFQMNHEDLANKIIDDISPNTQGFNITHGTFVAGLAGAETNNGLGKSSIGYNCSLLVYTMTKQSNARLNYEALVDLSAEGARVVNASWIHCGGEVGDIHDKIINLLVDNNTVVVAGAGNGNSGDYCEPDYNGYCYPASYDRVISVTSVDINDMHEHVPGPGQEPQIHSHNDKVDVCAPGHQVISTCWGLGTVDCYSKSSGTSFASPIVAGIAGLVLSVNDCYSPEEIIHIIKSTTDDVYSIPENAIYEGMLGTGRVNAYKAVSKAYQQQIPQDYTVTTGQVILWNDVRAVNSRLVIEKDASLTIKGDVHFNKNASLVIEPGGKLIVDGGYISSMYCSQFWEGIQVQGLSTESQDNPGKQGMLILKNGAIISNANVGVTLSALDDNGNMISGTSGGIIEATDSHIINTVIGVDFGSYQNTLPGDQTQKTDNKSFFQNITFKNTSSMDRHDKIPEAFVKLNGVDGVKFLGCTFRNTKPIHESPYQNFTEERGAGIKCYSSSFIIDEVKVNDKIKRSQFKSLYQGIVADGKSQVSPIIIRNTEFDTLYRCIELNKMNNVIIENNLFTQYCFIIMNQEDCVGLFLNECTGYTIQQNFFTTVQTNTIQKTVGLRVVNSGALPNMINSNVFTHLETGIHAWGENRAADGTGLVLRCNEFKNNEVAIKIGCQQLTPEAGIAASQGDMSDPAGNWFERLGSCSSGYCDIDNNANDIEYYHHDSNQSPSELMPYSSLRVTLVNTSEAYQAGQSCPITFDIWNLAELNGYAWW